MAEKKISFGFKIAKKQSLLLPTKIDTEKDKKNDIELIQCLEGQTIKLVKEKEEEKLLVIPLKNSQKTSAALASLKNLKKVLDGEEQTEEGNDAVTSDTKAEKSNNENGPLSLEQRVIKELLNDGNDNENDDESDAKKLTLHMAADRLPLDGAEQSTIDDYDQIPITQFGLAMLRGMGLKDEEIKSKQNKEPELRPKGMGLGADKVVKKAKLLVAPAANETLEIKKNAYVRILGGKFKDLYGQIEGLDDHACRVIVKLALGGSKEAFNEFMVQPVSKKEYQEYGKVINSVKYDEYKRKQEEKEMKNEIKTEMKKEIKSESSNIKSERASSRERNESRSKSERDSSPKYRKDDKEYGSNSRHRSRERVEQRSRNDSRDRRDRNRDKSRDRGRRSSSYDRNKTKDVERDSYKNRRSRSTDKFNSHSSNSRNERSKDDKHSRRNERARSPSKSSSSDGDTSDSDDSRHKKRSHHKKTKKKSHKKKSSKGYDSSDDDRHIKKRTKKSKRERSRSTGRR